MAEKVFAGSKWRGRFFAYAPLVLWIVVILTLGSGPGSMAQTSRFVGPLIEFFFPGAAPETFLAIHVLIRKAAHFVEYAILALLAARAFASLSASATWRHLILLPLALTASVACIDEINQSFQTSRTSSSWDVFLDQAGAITALAIFYFFRKLWSFRTGQNRNRKPNRTYLGS